MPRLARLLTEIEAVDGEGEESSEEAVRATMTWPGHDPTRDRWVVEEPGQPGRLIAHSLVWKGFQETHADLTVAVHPAWRRRGLGCTLLEHALDRARTLGVTAVRIYANEQHLAASAFLQRHGFAAVAAYTEMRFPAESTLDNPVFPTGYQVRSYDELQDISLLAYTMTAAYRGLWGHHVVGADDLAHWLPSMRLDGIFLSFDKDGDAVGICRGETREPPDKEGGDKPIGYVDAPGVVPARRSEALYVPLLLTAMHWLRAQGIDAIRLESWGDDEATLRQYHELGFTTERRAISYRLNL